MTSALDTISTEPPLAARIDDPKKIDFSTVKASLLSDAALGRLWNLGDTDSKMTLLEGFAVLADRSRRVRQGVLDQNSSLFDLDTVLDAAGDLVVEASRLGGRWRDMVFRAMKGEPDRSAPLRFAAVQVAVKMAQAGYPMIQATEALCRASRDREARIREASLEGLLLASEWVQTLVEPNGGLKRSVIVWGVDRGLEEAATHDLGRTFQAEIRAAIERVHSQGAER